LVPRIRDIPRLDAIMTNGESSFSRARFRNEKHSMSNMCTSSMKRICDDDMYNVKRTTMCIGKGREKTYTRDDFRLALFSPLRNLGVNLVPQFWFDLAGVASKEGKEPLRTTVDYVDFMKRNRVYNFFSFLDFTLGTLHKFSLPDIEHLRVHEIW